MDTIINYLKNRFEKNQPLLQAFSLFAPHRFPQLVKSFKTVHDLQACLKTFCKMHNIDAFRRADELFNFVCPFEKFDCSSVCQQEDDDDSGEDDDYDDADDEDNGNGDDDCYHDVDDNNDKVSSTSDNEQSDNGVKKAKTQSKKKFHLSLTLFTSL